MSFPAHPPISMELPDWGLPEVHERQLDWGLRLKVIRIGHLPMVHARMLFRRGRVLENPARLGSARLLGVLARHGTESYASAELARALDQLGLRLRMGLGQDSSSISITALSEHREAALDLLDEVAFRPNFPESHLRREQEKALDVHRHEVNDPGFIGGAWMSRILYPDHPYGRPPATAEGLQATTREDIQALHRAVFQPSQGLLLVIGDVDPEPTLDALTRRYRDPVGSLEDPVEVPLAPPSRQPRILAIERPDSEQVRVQIGSRLFSRSHEDYYPIVLMNRVLGAGASSRLFMELRERQSLTYGAYSSLDLGRYAGDIVASLDCAPEKGAQALNSLETELNRMRQEPLPEGELEVARRTMSGAFPQRALGLGGIAGLLSLQWSHSLPSDVWERHLGRIAAVPRGDVERVARRWLQPEARSIVLIGPRAALESSLEGRTGVRHIQASSLDWAEELT